MFLHPCQVPHDFISTDAIIAYSRNTSNHALFAQFFKGERECIYFKRFSGYEIKQNLSWRGLFAIQLAL